MVAADSTLVNGDLFHEGSIFVDEKIGGIGTEGFFEPFALCRVFNDHVHIHATVVAHLSLARLFEIIKIFLLSHIPS